MGLGQESDREGEVVNFLIIGGSICVYSSRDLSKSALYLTVFNREVGASGD